MLDRAEALRAKRRAALAQLDTLTQSIFLDLFGDPTSNRHKWPRRGLDQLCKSTDDIKCGPFGTQLAKSEVRSEGIPLWGIKNVNALFALPAFEFLDDRTAKRLMQYSLESGDIVAEDYIGRWLEEDCIKDEALWTSSASLFSDYKAWCERNGDKPTTPKGLTQSLEARGFIQKRTNSARGFSSIGVRRRVTHVTD